MWRHRVGRCLIVNQSSENIPVMEALDTHSSFKVPVTQLCKGGEIGKKGGHNNFGRDCHRYALKRASLHVPSKIRF